MDRMLSYDGPAPRVLSMTGLDAAVWMTHDRDGFLHRSEGDRS